MYDDDNNICLIEDDHDTIAIENPPDPGIWQSFELSLQELDCASGVCWHPAAENKTPSPRKPTTEQRLHAIRQQVASWFVQLDGKFVSTTNKDSRLGIGEIEKILPQMLAERFPDNELVERNASKLVFAAIYCTGADPRSSFGVYSGKAYPAPGNPSSRLYRNRMWDLNTWRQPTYRELQPSSTGR